MTATLIEKDTAPAVVKVGVLRRLRNAVGGFFLTLAFVVGAPVAANAAPTLPDPGTTATTLATAGGAELADTAVVVVPVIIGVLAVFWAIRLVMRKLGLGGTKI